MPYTALAIHEANVGVVKAKLVVVIWGYNI